jgi:RecG-like helicase
MIDTITPIADVRLRERVRVRGRVRSVRVRPWADSPTLEVVLVDDTGGISVVFLARRRIGGVHPGTIMSVEGMVGSHQRRLAILNPEYELEGPGVSSA